MFVRPAMSKNLMLSAFSTKKFKKTKKTSDLVREFPCAKVQCKIILKGVRFFWHSKNAFRGHGSSSKIVKKRCAGTLDGMAIFVAKKNAFRGHGASTKNVRGRFSQEGKGCQIL